ncbi:hypothetical protein EEB13_30245 [Rhodococcus sp. WS3]|uniref:hypothetical protein n=1 Tax=unclassified Rhodococcus (in: high G+C Gram-positive bacteria) TaxID=192944 RepID=UPI0005E25417|nr:MULTISPECIES: hypothetical protein [unclassified Rhodococcus (in: high G+C Gram-positive bacteria)]KJF19305.1 hypothetical protein SZ00_06232 [Rhodococcus sp. AD45]ROZ42739.1 hypothetical protein EEB13_30245 [Rhodococcus sp. WS3]RZL21774.1 MAG: hypothetical protein EOP31_26100 [Rhodococcus sp. (in: high G+C Gram-positive bacteria)]
MRTDNDLSRQILDGPSATARFTSEICILGGDVTACNVAYFENSAGGIAAIATSETDRRNRCVRAHAEQHEWTFFAGPDEKSAARTFHLAPLRKE